MQSVARVTGNGETFAELFEAQSAERLTSAAQTALVEFARKGHATGLRATTLRLDKGLRRVLLCDRSAVDEKSHKVSPEVLTQAPMVLVHHYVEALISMREVQAALDDMTEVAAAVERSFS